MAGPYGTIADVKMLNLFRTIGVVGIAVLAWLAVGIPFCIGLYIALQKAAALF